MNDPSFLYLQQNNNQVPGDGTIDPSQVLKNGHAPGFIYSIDDRAAGAAGMLSATQNPIESEMRAGVSYRAMENPVGFPSKASSAPILSQPNYASIERGRSAAQPEQRSISDIDNMAAQSQSQWLRPSGPGDYSVSGETLNEQEELTIDEGTISVSTAYSHKYVLFCLGVCFAFFGGIFCVVHMNSPRNNLHRWHEVSSDICLRPLT